MSLGVLGLEISYFPSKILLWSRWPLSTWVAHDFISFNIGEEEAPEEVAGDPIDNEPESDEAPIKHGVNKKT